VRESIKKILPFRPTESQKKVLAEIAGAMAQPTPMRRLLQGDVGSGKTIIALQAAINRDRKRIPGRAHGADRDIGDATFPLRARILESAGYRIALLTGSLEQDRKRDTRRHIARGDVQLVIGTHALIEEKVEFDKLGLGDRGRAASLRRDATLPVDEEEGPVGAGRFW